MIDDIHSDCFLRCLRSCGEGREDGFSSHCGEFVCSFLCQFENGSSRDRIGQLYSHEYVVAIVEKLYHTLVGVTWVELADKDTRNAFLN